MTEERKPVPAAYGDPKMSVSFDIQEPSDDRLVHTASAPLPTRFGIFDLHVFRWNAPDIEDSLGLSNEHIAMVMGNVESRRNVPVRVHSECMTSEVFGSLKCDCREQLERAQAEVARRGFGVVLYLRQEGRGIGLTNKIRAYALQAQGADTIEANELLHLPVDARQYDVAAAMLKNLGVESIELMTNNPDKIDQLRTLGITVEKRIPALVAANPFSAGYLDVKRRRMAHEIPANVVATGHQLPDDSGRPALHVISSTQRTR